ncbi:CYTH and CHAD domain-containing protein [Actinomadura parmotrematis]|uniref:CYTH and CHAD domain-containing protein n=1 Tax=Actinomadura parmotrematis TaxID=2864039 RepID=A0ABS7FP88_9ACTN|nr:CYTH and CHAD domain-containing protein [Actinomadura parmotrematis]MBW8482035.1 CYTH and CHAD domain-containing protein [Actinomadura parmotrematis]
MSDEHVEIERKYDADAGFAVPDLDGLPGVASVGEPERHELHASYFDTAGLRLAAAKITLRRRKGGTDAGWHLKLPAADGNRLEIHAPLGSTNRPPKRLADLVASVARGEPLRPVATLDTARTTVLLLDEAGRPLAEIADDLVTGRDLRETSAVVFTPEDGAETGGADGALRWREVEVELKGGSPDVLKAVGKRLKRAGASRSGSASKLSRVLATEADTTRADIAARAGRADATAGDAVVAYIAAYLVRLLDHDPRARQDADGAVHQMRTAARRIRSALQSYESLFDAERTGPLKDGLKWLGGDVLGETRDLEVLRERFTGRLADLGEPEPAWTAALPRQQAAAHRKAMRALTSERYYELLDALDAFVTDPPFRKKARKPAADVLPGLIQKSWWRLERKHAAITGADDADIARHETRKAAKRARYAAELAEPVLGKPAKRAAKQAKRVQTVLGDYQDGVVALERLHAVRPKTSGEAFATGAVYGVEHCRAGVAKQRLADLWTGLTVPIF